MPLISDIKKDKSPTKSFKKVAYRPWDNEEVTLQADSTQITSDTANIERSASAVVYDNNSDKISKKSATNQLDLKKEERNLFGAQRNIFIYLIQNVEETFDDFVITKCITVEDLSRKCDLLPNTIKATLQKLKAKSLIDTYENKPGRGGFARYRINNEIFTFFIEENNFNHIHK